MHAVPEDRQRASRPRQLRLPWGCLLALCLALSGTRVAAEAESTERADEAAVWRAESSLERVQLIELYSSQGCSSCPPAERWMSQWLESPDLWTRRVPVNFHVDYWDRLGWPDPYASAAYTRRQYDYAAELELPSAYTPGFVVDGKEWRGFFASESLRAPGSPPIGKLAAWIPRVTPQPTDRRAPAGRGEGSLEIQFLPASATSTSTPSSPTTYSSLGENLEVHVALLGVGLCDRIERGENTGRRLRQDFVVLGHERVSLESDSGRARFRGSAVVPEAVGPSPERYALAVWISRRGKQAPLQATGAWLGRDLVSVRGSADPSSAQPKSSQVACP